MVVYQCMAGMCMCTSTSTSREQLLDVCGSMVTCLVPGVWWVHFFMVFVCACTTCMCVVYRSQQVHAS